MSYIDPRKYSNPVDYVSNYVQKNYIAPIKSAHNSGTQQIKSDVLTTYNAINTVLGGAAGAAASKSLPKTPQQALLTVAGTAAGVAVTAATAYVKGFGKALGFFGK